MSNFQSTKIAAELCHTSANGETHSIDCQVRWVDRPLIVLLGDSPVPAGSAVSLEWDDNLFLGEILTSRETSGSWTITLRVDQVLSGLTSLLNLSARMLGELVASHSRPAA